MTNTFIPTLSPQPLYCVWIKTGNPSRPLECVWIDPNSGAISPIAGTTQCRLQRIEGTPDGQKKFCFPNSV